MAMKSYPLEEDFVAVKVLLLYGSRLPTLQNPTVALELGYLKGGYVNFGWF